LEEEKFVDMVVGPDAYRDLPNLIKETEDGRQMANVVLSLEETYADITPMRLDKNGVSGFISIMRGCDNYCAYCVVPYTRGHERSRDPKSIIAEAQDMVNKGYKEVTLLGQNVNSFHWKEIFSDSLKKVVYLSQINLQKLMYGIELFAIEHKKNLSVISLIRHPLIIPQGKLLCRKFELYQPQE